MAYTIHYPTLQSSGGSRSGIRHTRPKPSAKATAERKPRKIPPPGGDRSKSSEMEGSDSEIIDSGSLSDQASLNGEIGPWSAAGTVPSSQTSGDESESEVQRYDAKSRVCTALVGTGGGVIQGTSERFLAELHRHVCSRRLATEA